MRVGVYPGTFDPVTCGHFDIIERASHLVDKLIIAVAENPGKAPLFNLTERLSMLENHLSQNGHEVSCKVECTPLDGLLIDFVKRHNAQFIIRGLRAVSDFEYEFQMASMNRRLSTDVETVFLMSSEGHHFVSSRFIKEVARLGGDIDQFVTPYVSKMIKQKYLK